MNDTVVAIVSAFRPGEPPSGAGRATPRRTAARAGRGTLTTISTAGRAALGEGKLPRVLGRGRGAR
jgi:hypothetical protein